MAATIRTSFTKYYTCYRFGGDEFSIIGHETDQDKIDYRLRTMTNTLAEMREQGNPLPTVSSGYSIFEAGEKLEFQKNLRVADDQMYYFKTLQKAGATDATPFPVKVHDTSTSDK